MKICSGLILLPLLYFQTLPVILAENAHVVRHGVDTVKPPTDRVNGCDQGNNDHPDCRMLPQVPSPVSTLAPVTFPPVAVSSTFPTVPPFQQPVNAPFAMPDYPTANPPSPISPTDEIAVQPSLLPASNGPTFAITNSTQNPSKQPTALPSPNTNPPPTTGPPTTTETTAPANISPTSHPIYQPSQRPTTQPTVQSASSPPTANPSKRPSTGPTTSLTVKPTFSPSRNPTKQPTFAPTSTSTTTPSKHPTLTPSGRPTPTPSTSPTQRPSNKQTLPPTGKPIFFPTKSPTKAPSIQPTFSPTKRSTPAPSKSPSAPPSGPPTNRPTSPPSNRPTSKPTITTFPPSQGPAPAPSLRPTPVVAPSVKPTKALTPAPTRKPTPAPTKEPCNKEFDAVVYGNGVTKAVASKGTYKKITSTQQQVDDQQAHINDYLGKFSYKIRYIVVFKDGKLDQDKSRCRISLVCYTSKKKVKNSGSSLVGLKLSAATIDKDCKNLESFTCTGDDWYPPDQYKKLLDNFVFEGNFDVKNSKFSIPKTEYQSRDDGVISNFPSEGVLADKSDKCE